MGDPPTTRFAKTGLGRIAYQVIGDGPIDLVVHSPRSIPVDGLWDQPRLVRCLTRLSGFCRHIWFDPRGSGASDPVPEAESRFAETTSDDMLALVDALGLDRVAVISLASGPSTLTFAASHPERMKALVLRYPWARLRLAVDYPEGLADEPFEQYLREVEDAVGTDVSARAMAGSDSEDRQLVGWLARMERAAWSPAVATRQVSAALESDLRHTLGTINVPTLVVVPPAAGRATLRSRYVADHIPGAIQTDVPGDTLFFTGDPGPFFDAVEEFLTGSLPEPDVDRVLATVLFTDIVGSTETTAAMGDRRWQETLDRHDAVVAHEVERHRGRVIKLTGDGVVATFDGPGRAIRCAAVIRGAVRDLGVDVRAGLHSGEIQLRGGDIAGIAVVMAQRVSSLAGPGQVLVSRTVADLVAGSGIQLQEAGEHELKGVPGTWQLFSVPD